PRPVNFGRAASGRDRKLALHSPQIRETWGKVRIVSSHETPASVRERHQGSNFMRRMLVAAVALGPLVVASGAYAQTVVSNTRTTPIATATANSGSPADIEVTTSGRIEVQSGAAITVDSDNDVENEGVIEMDEADDGGIGILIEAGHNATVTNAGTIRITDDLDEAEGTDDDGDADGPMATGTDR